MEIGKVEKERKGSDLEERTIAFAITVIEFVSLMPRGEAASVVCRQLLRSATSIGANYREANRAESKADFIHKTSLAQKEAAETDYWLQNLPASQTRPIGHG
jgi:four helix bundle protein